MRLFPRLIKAASTNPSRIFQSLFHQAAPDPKGADFLSAYTGWVYAATNVIAQHAAAVPLRLERKSGENWVEVTSHLVLDTLNDANPLDTRSGLTIASVSYLSLVGESVWFVVNGKATKKPAELYPLDPTRVKVAKSSIGHIAGFAYRNDSGQDIPLDPHEVVFMRRFNPRNRYRGMGPLQAAAIAVDTDTYAGKWVRNFFFNSATVEAVLETDGTLTTEQFENIKSQWESRYQGVENAHKTAILEGGLKYKPISISQRDMQFLESRKFSRDEILGIFGVPKSLVSITDDVNLANALVHRQLFAANTIQPLMTFYCEALTEFLLPLFGLDHRKWRLTFDSVLPVDQTQELARKESGIRSGFYTINEVRAEEGLDPVEGGDIPLVSNTLTPITQAGVVADPVMSPSPPSDEHPTHEPDEEPEAKTKALKAGLGMAEINQGIKTIESETLSVFSSQRDDVILRLQERSSKTLSDDEPALERDQVLDRTFEDFEGWDIVLAAALATTITSLFTHSAERAARILGGSIDLNSPTAIQFLANHALESAKGVNHTMKDEIKARLVAGLEAGDSIDAIAESIKSFYQEQAQWRAERLARTEVMNAYGQGAMEGARQSGMQEKQWVGGPNCCDYCAENERSGWIALERDFPSGHLTHPAHPNCTCAITFRGIG